MKLKIGWQKLPLPSHLLCHEYFQDAQAVELECLTRLKAQGIDATSDKAFPTEANDVMQVYQLVRDSLNQNQVSHSDFKEDNGQDVEELFNNVHEELNAIMLTALGGINANVLGDHEQAVICFRKAPEQGNADGQFNLGAVHYNGKGIRKNIKQAVFWFCKAAEQGNAEAQEALTELGINWENT